MDMAAGELAKTRPKALSVPVKGREPGKSISHRAHRDHRGKTNGCATRLIHFLGESTKCEVSTSFSVSSVISVA
jgi:hypothetical protein